MTNRRVVLPGALLGMLCMAYAGCGDDGPGSATRSASQRSGADGRIVYAKEGAGPIQLFTVKPDGSGTSQITHLSDGEPANADWSPDGSRLTYEVGSDKNAGVFVSAADGSGARNLTPHGFQGQPAFSPDGRSIAFERDVGANGVHLMNSDGSHVRRLTRNPFPQPDSCGCDTDPNFSPDGKTVTFVRVKRDEQLAALFSIRVDGSHLSRLTPYAWDVAIKHDWSPDGKRIALTIGANPQKGESANIVTIRPDGSGLKRLTNFTDGQRSAYIGSYSPDGKRIAFRLERGARFSLSTMDSRGGAIRTVTSGPFKPRFIDWGSSR